MAEGRRSIRSLALTLPFALLALAANVVPARADFHQPGPSFQQPDGWTRSLAPDGRVFFQAPTTAGGFRPNINISDSNANYFKELDNARTQLPSAGAQIDEDAPILCSTFSHADRLAYTMPVQGRSFSFVQIILGDQSSLHVITYTRLAGTDADPAALRSLQSYCN